MIIVKAHNEICNGRNGPRMQILQEWPNTPKKTFEIGKGLEKLKACGISSVDIL